MMMAMSFMMSLYFLLPFLYLFIYQAKGINPSYVGMILLISIFVAVFPISMNADSNLVSFISFLILAGGLMVIFMYFSSFNESGSNKLGFYNSVSILSSIFLYLFFIYLACKKMAIYLPWSNSIDTKSLFNLLNNDFFHFSTKIYTMYLYNNIYTMMFLLMFMFICLTTIVKMCLDQSKNARKMM